MALSGVAGDDASVPKSSDRSKSEYAAALSSLLSFACAMLAPDGDLSKRAKPVKLELERLGINRSLYEVLTGDDVLLVPMLLRFCFIGDPGPLHNLLATDSSCKLSLDIPAGKLSVRAVVAASPPRPCTPFSLSTLLSSMRSICPKILQSRKGAQITLEPNSLLLLPFLSFPTSASVTLFGLDHVGTSLEHPATSRHCSKLCEPH